MDRTIVTKNYSDYQLVAIGIELVHKIICLSDNAPELKGTSSLFSKAHDLALRWNETFLDAYIPSSTGGI